ncbi:MAG: TolC family protein [Planctomycetota bacterium]|nr:TolC family protein [Planctomycetota bacterium]
MKHIRIWGAVPVILICVSLAVLLRAAEEPEPWPFRIDQQHISVAAFDQLQPIARSQPIARFDEDRRPTRSDQGFVEPALWPHSSRGVTTQSHPAPNSDTSTAVSQTGGVADIGSQIPGSFGHTVQPDGFATSPTVPQSSFAVPDNSTSIQPASCDTCGPQFGHAIPASPHLSPYLDRAALYPDSEPIPRLDGEMPQLPNGFEPWWNQHIRSPLWANANSLPVNVDELVMQALEHSPQVLAAKAEPQIVRTSIMEEQGEFDWHAFLESTYDHNTDPVGNTLTTGGASRFRDHIWSTRGGVRRTNEVGGEIEASQKSGYQDNNSRFFVPNQQGTARLELSYTQPLLNGRGRAYNQSRIMLAHVDSRIAEDELAGQLQDHLLKVTESYWELYRARSSHLQKHKLLGSATAIQKTLEARQGVDAQQRQVLRARSAVASRRSEIARAVSSIRNAESKLRYLVNDPRLTNAGHVEMIPQEAPRADYIPMSMGDSLNTAIINRPDISQAIRRMKATCLRLNVARHEVLPTLDLVMSTYVAGLAGNSDLGKAAGRQFVDGGEPGYSIGLFFEVPLGNRMARARQERRQWEVRKALREFEATVEGGITKVELAFRESETSFREMLSRYQAMMAAENETQYLHERWKVLPGNDRSTVQLLEDLLDSQERLADEEADFTRAQVNYALALADLKRAMGTLMSVSTLTSVITEGERSTDGGLDHLPDYELAPPPEPPVLRVPNT